MNKLLTLGLVLLGSIASVNGIASETSLAFKSAYIRAPIPGMQNTSGYMTLTNDSKQNITLVSASSDSADKIEFHDHVMTNGVMKMTQLHQVKIKAGETITFQSGGLHLMVFGLKQVDQSKPINIAFLTTEGLTIDAQFDIKSIHQEHHHHH